MLKSVEDIENQLLGAAYLREGNLRQRLAVATLDELELDGLVGVEEWVLAGTVPLDVDLPESDLDILVHSQDPVTVRDELSAQFAEMPGFSVWEHSSEPGAWCVAFTTGNYPVEFFIQNMSLRRQRAFRHLVAEYVLLERHGEDLRRRIRNLKASGVKTEPAFAEVLGLDGDPYLALLEMQLQPMA